MTRTLITKFSRPFIAVTLAAGLALTPVSAAPARADSRDTANFIAALIALGVVGVAIDNNNKAQRKAAKRTAAKRSAAKRERAKTLPKTCLRTFETRYGNERFFGKPCLRNNYGKWKALPERCELTIRTRKKNGERVHRKVFEPRCLANAGYRTARR